MKLAGLDAISRVWERVKLFVDAILSSLGVAPTEDSIVAGYTKTEEGPGGAPVGRYVELFTLPSATAEAAGVMSAADKARLDGIGSKAYGKIYVKAGGTGKVPFAANEFLLLRVWDSLTGVQKTVALVSAIEPRNVLVVPLLPVDDLSFSADEAGQLTVSNAGSVEVTVTYSRLMLSASTVG